MSSYSQRMSGNNDGMDPDWKPESAKESEFVTLSRDLVEHFTHYAELLERHKDLNWDTHQISVHITKYRLPRIERIIKGLGIK